MPTLNPEVRPAAAGLVLAWDTCTLEGTLAAGSEGELLAESGFKTEKGHTWWLMPKVDSMLAGLGATPADLRAVAVGTGPGTFTGVKVGVTAAKAVALALGLPLFGASTLDTLAVGAPTCQGLLVSVVDARRGKLYAAAYRRTGGRLPERLTEYLCMEPGDIAREVLSLDAGPVRVVGDVIHGLVGALADAGVEVAGAFEQYPRARDLLALAWDALLNKDGRLGSAASVLPVYLKKPV